MTSKSRSQSKDPRGKRGDRPGLIKRPNADPGTTSYCSSPEPATAPGLPGGDRLLASGRSDSDGLGPIDRAEAIRRATAFLGADASKLPPRTLQKVLAEISDPAEETQAGPMELEGGSAPAILQSPRGVVLGSGHQPPSAGITGVIDPPPQSIPRSTGPNNPPPPGTSPLEGLPNEDTATESESEVESVELGPGDSVSQRFLAPLPLRATTVLPQPPPIPIPHVPHYADEIDQLNDVEMLSDTATVDESGASGPDDDDDDEVQVVRVRKRPRLTQPAPRTRLSPPHKSHIGLPTPHSRVPSTSRPLPSRLTHTRPASSAASNGTEISPHPTPSSTLGLLKPPPTSDLSAVLTWAAQLAKQLTCPPVTTSQGAGSSRQAGRASQPEGAYDLVTGVLESLRSNLATAAPEPQVPARQPLSQTRHTDFIEDDAEMLEAEAALELGLHVRPRRKPTLADFPGLPRRVATLAIPELIAVACTQGAYEVFGTLSDWADETYNKVWVRELGKLRLQKAPPALKSIMVHRISWFRGDTKERIRPVVPHVYPFVNPPRTREDLVHNRKLVKKLVPSAFHCRDIDNPNDKQYEHPALQECIASAFFWGPGAVGMVHHDKFRPIPLPTVAMVLTTMQHCIKEWKTGRFIQLQLNAGRQQKIYDAHLKGLLQYAKPAPKRLSDFRCDWFWYG